MIELARTLGLGSARCSTPPGLVVTVWMQPDGDELVIVADLFALAVRPAWALMRQPVGLVDVARHRLSAPGQPRMDLGHYPDHPDQHPRHGHHPVTGHTHTTSAANPPRRPTTRRVRRRDRRRRLRYRWCPFCPS